MLIALHKNARTTPAVRAEIAASRETAIVLAQRFGITEQTVYKWKKRSVFGDRSHTAHHLQTVLTPAQETVVVHLRHTLLLPLDDLLAVTREFICPHVSRWTLGLIGELIRREFGVSLSAPTLGKGMAQLGFTPQRPLRRAYEQDAQQVQTWLDDTLPFLRAKAKSKGALLMFGDEAGCAATITLAPRGLRSAKPPWPFTRPFHPWKAGACASSTLFTSIESG
jgi:transposase